MDKILCFINTLIIITIIIIIIVFTGIETEAEDEDVMEYEAAEFKSPEQINEELITLSLLPTSRWLNLLHLDIIKVSCCCWGV